MSNPNLPDNSVRKNIIKFIHPNHQNRISNLSCQESILNVIKGFERYSRRQKLWNWQKYNKAKYRVTKDFFFTKLVRYPQHELETTKANIETNLELSKYTIAIGTFATLMSTKGFGESLKMTVLLLGIAVLSSAIIYQILATQLMRLNWIKIAIARKAGS